MRHRLDRGKPIPWPVSPLLIPEDLRGLWRGLVLAWPLWDAGQHFVEDVSGYGLHPAWGADLTPADWAATEYGPGLDFHDNSLEFLQVADPPTNIFDGFSAFSAEVTFIADTLSSFRGLIGKYRPTNGYRSWRWYYDAGQLELQVSSDGTAFEDKATTGLSLSTGVLYQALCTFNAGTFAVYVNGSSVSVTGNFSSQTSIYGGLQPLTLAQRRTSLDYAADTFDGRILSARVWTRALSADEARLLWERPWGMYTPDWGLPSLAVEHSGGSGAGAWQYAGEVDKGVQELLITGLDNGVSYDVQVKAEDLSENLSSGCTPVAQTPVAAAAVARQARGVLGAGLPRAPTWLRRLR